MNNRVLKTLEYDKILKALSSRASTQAGVERCLSLKPVSDIKEIRTYQKQTADAFSRLMKGGSLVFGGIKDPSSYLKRVEAGGSLNAGELLDICGILSGAAKAISYNKNSISDESKDSLTGYFKDLDAKKSLNDEIRRCIISSDEISDEASPALKDIRRKIGGIADRIKAELTSMLSRPAMTDILQDRVIAMRGAHFCLPVKAQYQSRVPGVICDRSSTGSTVFIEPSSVINLNNERSGLMQEEEKEIDRILATLSGMVNENSLIVSEDFRLIVFLDFVFAKASYAEDLNASVPEFNEERIIKIRKARHPLLDKEKAVPIDIVLGEDFNQLIITGPNTGGKTVSLKTAGLLQLMGQSGLHIPAGDRSCLGVFDEIYADIGDEQSIEQSLSTFSGHMKNVVYIMNHANDKSMVLFDELCAGTDPDEGAALAIAILNRLNESNVRTMATTHYSEIKVYALSTKGVENACCEFNVKTLSPTYHLLIGIPGKSNAFAISKKLGLSEDIIESARGQIDTEKESFEDLLGDLESRKVRIEREEARIESMTRESQSMRDKLSAQTKKSDDMRDQILARAREDAEKILKEAKEQADEAIRNINKYGSFMPSEKEAVKELEKQRANLRSGIDNARKKAQNASKKSSREDRPVNHPDPASLKKGDPVKVFSLDMKGTVHTLPDAKGNLTVQMGILKYKVHISDIMVIKEESESAKYKAAARKRALGSPSGSSSGRMSKAANISTEINLIGKNSDDAIFVLDKYLDDAFLSGIPSVRIVHGKGSGILRNAVRDHLKGLSYIESFREGEFGEGDAGVTIAVFHSEN